MTQANFSPRFSFSIKFLSLTSLISVALGLFISLVGFNGYEFFLYKLTPLDLLWRFLLLAPFILMVIYAYGFQKKPVGTKVLIPIVFGALVLSHLYWLLEPLIFSYGYSVAYSMAYILSSVIFVLGLINAIVKFSAKVLPIIMLVCSLFSIMLDLIDWVPLFVNSFDANLITLLFRILLTEIASALLYISIFLASMAKKGVHQAEVPTPTIILTPEQQLRQLNEKLAWGAISSEEYSRQRAEIISKL